MKHSRGAWQFLSPLTSFMVMSSMVLETFQAVQKDMPRLTNTYIPVAFWLAISMTVIFTLPAEARRLGLSQDNL